MTSLGFMSIKKKADKLSQIKIFAAIYKLVIRSERLHIHVSLSFLHLWHLFFSNHLFGLLQPFACLLDLDQMGRKREIFSVFVCWTRRTEDSRALKHQASTCWLSAAPPDLWSSSSSLSGRHGSHIISLITNRTGPALPQVNNIDTFKTHTTWQDPPLPEANGDCKMYFSCSSQRKLHHYSVGHSSALERLWVRTSVCLNLGHKI